MTGDQRNDRGAEDVHVALLRGINVGGKNKLPMKDLAAIFTDLGCHEVKTYIQSGNVVFRATPDLAERIPTLVAQAISSRFGAAVPVVILNAEELLAAARENPFLESGADEKTLHVAFLAKAPTEGQAATLAPNRSPPDEFNLSGRRIYLRCPKGMARTKLTNDYFDTKLATISTMRNWRTLLALCEMVDSAKG
jgi:uncharacterized protein (DUF1697 family)